MQALLEMTETTNTLRFSILGSLRAESGGREINLGGLKQRTLLAVLLLRANQIVSTDRLIHLMWGDERRDGGVDTLHVHMARLRRAFADASVGDAPLETIRPGYRLHADSGTLDYLMFEKLTKDASVAMKQGAFGHASELLTRALSLTRGAVLADLADIEAVHDDVESIENAVFAATVNYVDCQVQRGRHADALPPLERLVSGRPLDERLRGLLMVALYRAGRQADALKTYQNLRTGLVEELGVEPSPAIQELELKILDHHPSLAVPAVSRSTNRGVGTVIRDSAPAKEPAWIVQGEMRIPLLRPIVTIGRLPDRTIVVADEDASRRHAEIRRVGNRYDLVDRGSTNGTMVNGVPITQHNLVHGDKIEIGNTLLVFEQADETEGPR